MKLDHQQLASIFLPPVPRRSAPRLPREILDAIFSDATLEPFEEVIEEEVSQLVLHDPTTQLLSYSLVCRDWLHASRPLLYEIFPLVGWVNEAELVEQEGESEVESEKRKVFVLPAQLFSTLRDHPHLRAFVKQILVRYPQIEHVNPATGEEEAHAFDILHVLPDAILQALSLCENVKTLLVNNIWGGKSLDALLDMLGDPEKVRSGSLKSLALKTEIGAKVQEGGTTSMAIVKILESQHALTRFETRGVDVNILDHYEASKLPKLEQHSVSTGSAPYPTSLYQLVTCNSSASLTSLNLFFPFTNIIPIDCSLFPNLKSLSWWALLDQLPSSAGKVTFNQFFTANCFSNLSTLTSLQTIELDWVSDSPGRVQIFSLWIFLELPPSLTHLYTRSPAISTFMHYLTSDRSSNLQKVIIFCPNKTPGLLERDTWGAGWSKDWNTWNPWSIPFAEREAKSRDIEFVFTDEGWRKSNRASFFDEVF